MNERAKQLVRVVGPLAVAALSCAGARPAHSEALQDRVGPYALEVLMDGRSAATFHHAGQSYVLGAQGARYSLRVVNNSGRRVEAVVSVDGRDVLDGKPAELSKRGYLVPAWGSVEIDGWRLSQAQVAAFRFASVRDSYAARMGNARNVGVIGVALFPERYVPPAPPVYVPSREHDVLGGIGAGDQSAPAAPTASEEGAASSSAKRSAPSAAARPGLGTEFGERRHSEVREVTFVRAHARRPSVTLGARYDDRQGLYAVGIDVDGGGGVDEVTLRGTASPFPVSQRRFASPPAGWRR